MAPRSAGSRRSNRIEETDEAGGLSDLISRHRVALAGATAFAVAFTYVAANAIWYQPHAHGGAFFETRPISSDLALAPATQDDAGETIIRLEREETGQQAAAPELAPGINPGSKSPPSDVVGAIPLPSQPIASPPASDPVVSEVQRVLAELKFYGGTVDGLTGPRTRDAIETYRRTMGIGASAEIDRQLLDHLGIADAVSEPPLPQHSPGTDLIETASAVPVASKPVGDPVVMRIQAGLKAFGNDGIEIDGVVGSRTRSAIIEFQSLFGLPETGEPDKALYAKLREIGLTE